MTDTAAILALLAEKVTAYDGRPDTTPAGPYVAVFDDSGLGRRTHYDARTDRVKWTHNVMAVARTHDGLRWVVGQVRDTLTDTRPTPQSSMMVEISAGPVLTDGTEGDMRHSKTIVFTHTTTRESTP